MPLVLLSRQFNDAGVNISEATVWPSVEGRAANTFQVQIADVSKLRTLMRQLARVEGVHDVERI